MWWAIWEMDVFASTIRRCLTSINWMQIETLLPAEDQFWFQNKPQQSCFLERNVIYMWKTLQQCGNQSPKAWYIVINCLMQEARQLSSPRGVRPPPSRSNKGNRDSVKRLAKKLATLLNSIHCFVLALPSHLRYQNQYLDFAERKPSQTIPIRRLHSSIYSIYMMTQLATLMIHQYDAFVGPARVLIQESYVPDPGSGFIWQDRRFRSSDMLGLAFGGGERDLEDWHELFRLAGSEFIFKGTKGVPNSDIVFIEAVARGKET
jgi:hypothetical protein